MRARPRPHSLALACVSIPVAVAFSGTLYPRKAHANGRLPAAHQLVVSATDPSFFVLEATFGLFVSHDTGASFGWLCEPAIGYPSTVGWDPSIGITPSSVLAAIPQGVSVSTDQGCSWQVTLTAHVIDLVVRRDDPHSVLALASAYSGLNDAGENLFTTQVFATHDDGATWAPQGGAIEPGIQVETIDIAASDPNTIYIGGARTLLDDDGGVTRTGVVLASRDGGMSYAATSIPLQLPAEFQSSAFVSTVDPGDPQRVYVRVSQATGVSTSSVDRLLVSDDGAATFRTIYQGVGALPGFALSSDGSKVFVGDSVAGVLLSSASPADSGAPFAFAKRSPAVVGCLTWSAGALYACTGQPQNAFLKELGVSNDDGLTFSPEFRFGCVTGPLACSSGAVATTCNPELGSLQAAVGPCSDGAVAAGDGTPDAASTSDQDAGADPPRPRSASCGCVAGEAAGELGGLSAIGLVVALGLRRRRR